MIKSYDLKFYDVLGTEDIVLYERYVDQIAQVLEDSGIFTSVVKKKPDTPPGTYADYSVEGYVGADKVVTFSLAGAPVTNQTRKTLNTSTVTGHYANGTTDTYGMRLYSTSDTNTGMGLRSAYVTSNGVMFKINYSVSGANTYWGSIIIAKSNKAHPMIIGPTYGFRTQERGSVLACHQYTVQSCCYSDESQVISGAYLGSISTTYSTYYYNTTAKQTLMFPFVGAGSPNGDYTYSKYALWIPFAPLAIRNGGFQKVLVNDKAYITDGYFALRDD